MAILHFPISCGCGDCCDMGPFPQPRVERISWTVYLTDSTTIPTHSDLRFQVSVDEVSYNSASASPSPSFSFLPSVLACSPVVPDPPSVTSHMLRSDEPFYSGGVTYAAGTNLSALFVVRPGPNVGSLSALPQFLGWRVSELFRNSGGHFEFSLLDAPDSALNQRFYLELELSDETSFLLISPHILLEK